MSGTRRDFLRHVARAGGYRATYLTMQAMGLLSAAAYALGKAGYDVTVLEARDRVGGRNWTIRRGAKLDMTDGSRQVCEFDSDLYWNAGPARLPSHHQAVLGYCRELGVALEVEINTSRGARLLNPAANGGKPVQMRQAINDARGEISE